MLGVIDSYLRLAKRAKERQLRARPIDKVFGPAE
jgi:hypothetical protein